MKNENVIKNNGRTFRTAIAALIIALALTLFATLALAVRALTVTAWDVAGTVTIHVYDPEKNYSNLGAWVWLKGSSGRGYTTNEILSGEQFKKDAADNTAHSFQAVFSESEMSKLKTGTKFGMLICVPPGKDNTEFWKDYNKETADVYLDLSAVFDANNHADVYYIRKDTVAYTDVEVAKMALEKVTSARFIAKDLVNKTVTVAYDATATLTKDSVLELRGNGKLIKTAAPIIPEGETEVSSGTVVFEDVTFDFGTSYELYIKGIPTGSSVSMNEFIDDIDFIRTFECKDTQELEYGAIYTPEKTTFRVWAPFATSVTLNLYAEGYSGELMYTRNMKKRNPESWGGVWEYEMTGDNAGLYYTYTVDNGGQIAETIDPYAKAAGVNGQRGMVIDWAAANPEGWENDKHLYAMTGSPEGSAQTYASRADTPIVWEIQVKDFSSSPDSGMKYKGKYLAFTEENTHVPGKPALKTGLAYLKDLGITYVHLNPIYDFATVDETELGLADNTKDTYNWGYDPQNYNVLEGSYSTDPSRAEVRINEFKQMVMALHKAGIGVIMDVVYNHTYSTNGQALHDTVPNYYHRMTKDGTFSDDSGCGNATASERTMMRKYMVDSLKFWATEYHIDGFRFDLMGIHDRTTINLIRDELDALDDGNGTHLLMYGEPWSADGSYEAQSYLNRVAVTKTVDPACGKYTYNGENAMLKNLTYQYGKDWWESAYDMTSVRDRVAIFGGTGRDGMRGDNNPGQGWVNGDLSRERFVAKMIEGYCGTTGIGIKTTAGSQCVAYASAHDNYTLWDQFIGKEGGKETPLSYDYVNLDNIKRCKLVASAYMLASGIPFMLAGEEMGRTKYGNHNSYNSVSKLNQIVWSRQEPFGDLLNAYKTLIKIRLDNNGTFSYMGATDPKNCYYAFSVENGYDPNHSNGYMDFTKLKVAGSSSTINTNIHAVLNAADLKGYVTDGKTTLNF